MQYPQLRVRSQVIWYILWSTMFLIAVVNSMLSYPIFTGAFAFLFSLLLASLAGIQLARGVSFLRRKEAMLAAVLLITFGISQSEQWLLTMGNSAFYRGIDFNAYYIAAQRVSETPVQSPYHISTYADGRIKIILPLPRSSPWEVDAFHYHVPTTAPFIYPPLFAILMKPLTQLPCGIAYFIWNFISILLLMGAVLFSLRLGGVRQDWPLTLILGVGLFSYYPLRQDLALGQTDCVILFLLAVGVWLLTRKRSSLSALSLALATLIKLTPVIAVPIMLFRRQWKWLGAYAGWIIVLSGFSVWQVGWAIHLQFWREILPSIACGTPFYSNTSIVALVQEIFLGYVPYSLATPLLLPAHACFVSRLVAISLSAIVIFCFYTKRRDANVVHDLVMIFLFSLTVSPISWSQHYIIALLPFLYLWCRMPDEGDPLLLVLFLAVTTNILGFSILLTHNSFAQLTEAAIVPFTTIALVFRNLNPARRLHFGSPAPELDATIETVAQ